MSTVYTQKIFSIEVLPLSGELENVVIRVQWEYRAKNGPHAAWTVHTTELDSVSDTTNFTPFGELTESQVLTWINAKENMVALKTNLDDELQAVIDAPSKAKLPPWEGIDDNLFAKTYVLVANNQVIWGPKRWDTFAINRALLQNSINEIVPNVVPIVPENEPTEINDTTHIYQVGSYDQMPPHDIFEELGEPTWDFSTGKAVAVRESKSISIESAKEIVAQTAEERLLYGNFYKDLHSEKEYIIYCMECGEVSLCYSTMSDSDTFVWRAVDNSKIEFTKSELELVLQKMSLHFQSSRSEFFNIMSQVETATTVDELKQIYFSL